MSCNKEIAGAGKTVKTDQKTTTEEKNSQYNTGSEVYEREKGEKDPSIIDINNPQDQALIAKETFKTHYQNGLTEHNGGNYNKAISYFSQAIEMYNDYADAWAARGNSRYKSGNKDAACTDWQKASELGSAIAGNMVTNYCK